MVVGIGWAREADAQRLKGSEESGAGGGEVHSAHAFLGLMGARAVGEFFERRGNDGLIHQNRKGAHNHAGQAAALKFPNQP